jgi:hypothetical protein
MQNIRYLFLTWGTPAIAFTATLLPNVLVKRIRSIKHANWGTGTITFNATTTNLAAEIIPTPLLMLTLLNQ